MKTRCVCGKEDEESDDEVGGARKEEEVVEGRRTSAGEKRRRGWIRARALVGRRRAKDESQLSQTEASGIAWDGSWMAWDSLEGAPPKQAFLYPHCYTTPSLAGRYAVRLTCDLAVAISQVTIGATVFQVYLLHAYRVHAP